MTNISPKDDNWWVNVYWNPDVPGGEFEGPPHPTKLEALEAALEELKAEPKTRLLYTKPIQPNTPKP